MEKTHGDHWWTIFEDVEKDVPDLLKFMNQNGAIFDDKETLEEIKQEFNWDAFASVVYPEDSPIRFLFMLKHEVGSDVNEVIAAYPMVEGIVNEIEFENFVLTDGGFEGQIEGHAGCPIGFYDTLFYKNNFKYNNEERLLFSIAGLAYSIHKADHESITIKEGPLIDIEKKRALKEDPDTDLSQIDSVKLSLKGMTSFLPRESGIDDWGYRFKVEDIQNYLLRDDLIFKSLDGYFVKDGLDESSLYGRLYVSQHILGDYEPQIGDDIYGEMWLQGHLVELA
ncbi:MAG: hypothetical protein ISS11_08170 [Candidatus Marinimicrobia bacterium]|nr:hypothetical protein [Candidatus Neomarinimicrobiota bacterium]